MPGEADLTILRAIDLEVEVVSPSLDHVPALFT
jgi:hypothetical protein